MDKDLPLRNIDNLKALTRSQVQEVIEEIQLVEEINIYLDAINKKDARRSTGYFSPSSIPYCGRAMYYQRSGEVQNECLFPGTRIIFDIGTAIHGVLQDYITKALGDDCFRTEVFCRDDELHLIGSADGLLDLPYDRRLLEIKSISPKGFKGLAKPKSEHLMQAHCYAYMLDAPMLWFLYYEKSLGEMRLFTETFDKRIWGKVTDKLERIERCVEKGNPPPKELGYTCKECRYSWCCDPNAG